MSELIDNLTDDTFDAQVLASPVPVLVDFWATWCGPCRQMAPALDQAAAELEGQARVVKVDFDAAPGLAARYGISSVPTLMVFRAGQPVSSTSGAKSKRAILAQVSDAQH